MKTKIKLYPNGCSVHMEKLQMSGMYEVKILTRTSITDRMRIQTYSAAIEYFRYLCQIARNI